MNIQIWGRGTGSFFMAKMSKTHEFRLKTEETYSIGERLQRCRTEAGMTQARLAKTLKIDPATVSHYESGENTTSTDVLVRICEELHLSADYLLLNRGKSWHFLPMLQKIFVCYPVMCRVRMAKTDRDVQKSVSLLSGYL